MAGSSDSADGDAAEKSVPRTAYPRSAPPATRFDFTQADFEPQGGFAQLLRPCSRRVIVRPRRLRLYSHVR